MSKPWSNLASVVYKRTYSRNNQNKLETWKDTIDRVLIGNFRLVSDNQKNREEKELLRELMLDRKGSPAGRGLWFSGTEANEKIGGVALNNCWYISLDYWQNFVIAMDLLMLGGGVGASIEHQFVSKLGKVKRNVSIIFKNTKDADFIVPDSREGWCDLFSRILESYFVTGKSFSYSTICVRDYGTKINGFGGVSSGPLPLVKFVENICGILNNRSGKHVRPIDAMDILCSTGEMVIAGNVRRSAIIILGDAFDKEYLKAKRWDLGQIPNYRSSANLSIVIDDIEDAHPLFWETYKHGEAFGIFNRKNVQKFGRMGELMNDTAVGVNPCVTGDTEILTSDGYVRIDSVVDQEVEIWNGFEYSKVIPKVTGKDQLVYKVTFSNGQTLNVTGYHSFHIALDYGEKVGKFTTLDLEPGMKLVKYKLPEIEKENVYKWGNQQIDDDQFVTIVDVTELEIVDEVYCFNEPKRHTGIFNGILTGQCGESPLESFEACNLQEIALSNIVDVAEFEKTAKLLHRYGKRVTLEKYHHPEVQEVVNRNRRIGTGITGCLESDLFKPDILDRVYKAIQKENSAYSKQLNIPESIRTTLIKPSGTMSKVMDVDCEGVHCAFSEFMIQRIRFASNDPLIPLLKDAGHYMEPRINFDGTLDHSTLVVDFYKRVSKDVPNGESFNTWRQLDTLLMAQRYWADQAVSVTVYYRKEEIPELKTWLMNNLKYLKSISFLCYNDHGFKQAPKEAITEEQYVKFSSVIKPLVGMDEIGVGEDLLDTECVGGTCPIK